MKQERNLMKKILSLVILTFILQQPSFSIEVGEVVLKNPGKASKWYKKGLEATADEAKYEYYSLAIDTSEDKKIKVHSLNNRGIILLKMEKLDEAMADFDEAIKIDPKEGLYIYNKGRVLLKQGKSEEALKAFNKVIKLKPRFPWAFYQRALIKKGKESYKGAIKDLNKALKMRKEPIFYSERSKVKTLQGDKDGAFVDTVKAERLKKKLQSKKK